MSIGCVHSPAAFVTSRWGTKLSNLAACSASKVESSATWRKIWLSSSLPWLFTTYRDYKATLVHLAPAVAELDPDLVLYSHCTSLFKSELICTLIHFKDIFYFSPQSYGTVQIMVHLKFFKSYCHLFNFLLFGPNSELISYNYSLASLPGHFRSKYPWET